LRHRDIITSNAVCNLYDPAIRGVNDTYQIPDIFYENATQFNVHQVELSK